MITVYGANTTIEQLKPIKVKRPDFAGRYWKGIPHFELATAIVEDAEARGWGVGKGVFSLSNDNADLAGAFPLTIPEITVPDGLSLSLGLLTSNMQRRSLKMVVGADVAVCSNGMATGEIVMQRNHTTGFNFREEITLSLDQYAEKAKVIPEMVSQLRGRSLTGTESNELLMDAGRSGLLSWSRVGEVDKEYRIPRFAEHGTGTSWALLNAFTWTVKRTSPTGQMERMNKFREILPLAAAA